MRHETVSVDSCTYYSRGKSGTRSLAERQCVYMYCPLYDEWLLFVYLCVCFISPLLLFDCVRLYRIAGKYNIMIYSSRLVVADFYILIICTFVSAVCSIWWNVHSVVYIFFTPPEKSCPPTETVW